MFSEVLVQPLPLLQEVPQAYKRLCLLKGFHDAVIGTGLKPPVCGGVVLTLLLQYFAHSSQPPPSLSRTAPMRILVLLARLIIVVSATLLLSGCQSGDSTSSADLVPRNGIICTVDRHYALPPLICSAGSETSQSLILAVPLPDIFAFCQQHPSLCLQWVKVWSFWNPSLVCRSL